MPRAADFRKSLCYAVHECPVRRTAPQQPEDLIKVGSGPEADSFTKGGKRPFAADAKVRTDFRKADVRFDCRDIRSTNGG